MADEITYRGFKIEHSLKPIPSRVFDWSFVHEDYDGPEDDRCGDAESLAGCFREIDQYLDDETCNWCGSEDFCDCLDRADCPEAGKVGHRQCGRRENGVPNFVTEEASSFWPS